MADWKDEVREVEQVVRRWADTALCFGDGSEGDVLHRAAAILERLADDKLSDEFWVQDLNETHETFDIDAYRKRVMGEDA